MMPKEDTSPISREEAITLWNSPGNKQRLISQIETTLRSVFIKTPKFPYAVSFDVIIDSFGIYIRLNAGSDFRHIFIPIEEMIEDIEMNYRFYDRLKMQAEQLYRVCTKDPSHASDQIQKTIYL